jgi:hypothetical protein
MFSECPSPRTLIFRLPLGPLLHHDLKDERFFKAAIVVAVLVTYIYRTGI